MIKIHVQEYMYHLTEELNFLNIKGVILCIPFDQFYRQN